MKPPFVYAQQHSSPASPHAISLPLFCAPDGSALGMTQSCLLKEADGCKISASFVTEAGRKIMKLDRGGWERDPSS